MDPLSLMLMAAKAGAGAESGAPQQMLQPSGAIPQPQPMGPQNPMTAQTAGAPPAQQQGLGDLMSGIKAPQGVEPKFSGGVSGSGLPYVGRIEDMLSPFLQASGAGKPQMLPTLGMLLSQAPGGGR